MLTRRFRSLSWVVVLATAGAAFVGGACDLNPQPLPPGELPPTSFGNGGTAADAGVIPGNPILGLADAGVVSDAATSTNPPSSDGGTEAPGDAAATDAAAFAEDAAVDASSDAALDAPSDADAANDAADAGDARDASDVTDANGDGG